MVNQDFGFRLMELSRRITTIEEVLGKLSKESKNSERDWDNSTLLREWSISKRTAANYRKKGLEYYMRGGLIFYTPENRRKFIGIKRSPEKRKD